MKIYEKDGHCSSFDAKVLSCEINKNGLFDIVLSQTAFFPEGGGQCSDEGKINDKKVIEVKLSEDGNSVIHTLEVPFSVGDVVHGEIDMDVRFSRMQNHTAEHICSGIVHSLFGYENTGFHMGQDEITMDFNGILSSDDLQKVEELANKAIYDNLPITITFYAPGEARDVFYRSKKEINSTLRLVEIKGIDVCACCAPHVASTGEIGLVKILGFQKYKGGTRVSLLAGKRAFDELTKHYNNVKKISNSLSSNPQDICERFKQLQKELYETKVAKTAIKNEYYSLIASQYDNNIIDNIIYFDNDSSIEEIRFLTNLLKDKTSKICAVFTGTDNEYKFIAASNNADMIKFAQYLRTSLKASCGGKAQMIQGSILASQEEIRYHIEQYER